MTLRRVARRWPARALAQAVLAVALACALPASTDVAFAAGGPSFPRRSLSTDLLLVRSAELQTSGVLALSVGAGYHESMDAASVIEGAGSGEYTAVDIEARYGLTTWLEVSAFLPARRAAWDLGAGGSSDVTGLDAPVVGLKLGVPTGSAVFSLALGARAGLPLGDELLLEGPEGGSLRLSGGNRTDVELALLATADLTGWLPLRVHANVGWAFNRADDTGRRFFPDYYPAVPEGGGASDNDALILRGAVEFPGKDVDLFTEFRGDLFSDRDLIALKENPLTVTPGIRVRLGDRWAVTGGFSLAISGDDAATPEFDPHEAYPDWAATISLSYTWPAFAADTDGDTIPDYLDLCPGMAEDHDGFRDEDGCPDPDNDQDGVPDGFDGRPLLMEDYDGFEDDDGVPDLDNDGDGIVDERDMCPDEREDLDGYEDEDGCPDD